MWVRFDNSCLYLFVVAFSALPAQQRLYIGKEHRWVHIFPKGVGALIHLVSCIYVWCMFFTDLLHSLCYVRCAQTRKSWPRQIGEICPGEKEHWSATNSTHILFSSDTFIYGEKKRRLIQRKREKNMFM